ncbi:alkaline phosphatase family protein [Talaromyces proteolyticus]|uniref:Alkaline phosphatase family protein n=1 Tax=Talaromyces proteolyticus TaxID=1131652 RepID=A0AAD4KVY6_9EURO|nr:alkaline phosphatase family protein [Talaromyces proteolyticus]KAH8702223.1 alkaline phosphatase family protein [Talaromyces proteolyticus]
MTFWLAAATTLSSVFIRIASFVFLRWIPGGLIAPIILTASGIYLSSTFLLLGPASRQPAVQDSKLSANKQNVQKPSRSIAPWKTLLLGRPSAANAFTTIITILINLLLTALTLDFLLRARVFYPTEDLAFSRIGYVSPTTANLLVREPYGDNFPVSIKYQEASKSETGAWTEEGKIYQLNAKSDYTYPVVLKNLKPSIQYRYALSNNHTGLFTTAPLPGTQSANRLTFLTSSCIKPNFPYNPFSHPLRIPGIEQVSEAIKKLPSLSRPSFMLFLGDFIYIDVPLRYGSSVEEYRSEYRRVYSSPSWYEPEDERPIDLPWIHTLDDHEIANDWAKGNTSHPYPEAVDPYALYHVSVNPPIPPTPYAAPENTTYFSFIQGPASIFMLDTRTYRTTPGLSNSTILGHAQLNSLLAYLARPEPADVKWKIVASSVPFTKNWHIGTQDTWGGFLLERQTVYEAMWRAEKELGVRIILLSGDRHEFGATRFPDPAYQLSPSELAPGTPGQGIHEFSVGPLNMFYLPIRTYRQTDSEDVMVKYAPDGNVKFGQIDIGVYDDSNIINENNKGPHSVLTYTLHVDGNVVWKYQLAIPLHAPEVGRLPPGRVLVDDIHLKGWGLQEFIGLLEEKVGVLRDKLLPFVKR